MQLTPPAFPILSVEGERDALLAPYRHAVQLIGGALALPGVESALKVPAIRSLTQGRAEAWDAVFATLALRWAQVGQASATGSFLAASARLTPAALEFAKGNVLADEPAAAPLMAWAEWELFKVRPDRTRLEHAFEVLFAEQRAREQTLRRRNGMYGGTQNAYKLHATSRFMLGGRVVPSLAQGSSWVDASAMHGLNLRVLSEMARLLGRNSQAAELDWSFADLAARINSSMWSEDDGWYYDTDEHGMPLAMRTLAGLWPMLAGVAPRSRADRMLARLGDPTQFERAHPLSTLAASEADYRKRDGTPVGVVRAEYNLLAWESAFALGYGVRAQRLCESHLRRVTKVLGDSGELYLAYDPDRDMPAPIPDGNSGADAPVALACVIQETLGCLFGLRPHANRGELELSLHMEEKHRVEGLPFALGLVNFEVSASPANGGRRTIELMCDLPLKLRVRRGEQAQVHELSPGMHTLQA